MVDLLSLDPFSRLLVALEPWLDQIVIVGGWAHQLYRLHPDAQRMDYMPVTTLDTDVAIPATLDIKEQDIRERLVTEGFSEELLGDSHPPATHYRLGGENAGFYAEFLTPLIGSDYDRKHQRKTTLAVAGIVSQQLRYIELLLLQPWSIDFAAGDYKTRVRIANPSSYLAQKVLIHSQRKREDRAKDIVYIHDTLEVFGSRLEDLGQLWREVVAPTLPKRAIRAISQAAQILFSAVTDDIRRAYEITGERGRSAESIRQICEYGMREIFGS